MLYAHCYQYTKQPYLNINRQSVSIFVPDDSFKYSYVACQKILGQPAFLLYIKLDMVQPSLTIEKKLELRHIYFKATAFSIPTPGTSRSPRISLLQSLLL